MARRTGPILLWTAAALALVAAVWLLAARLADPGPAARSALGQERPIGGFDPHLVVALTSVERAAEAPAELPPASGSYVLLTLRARSTAAEISVDPGALDIFVEGKDGTRFRPVEAGPYRARFEPGELPPGGARQRAFLFDLPPDWSGLELWVVESTWLTALLPGGRESRLLRKLIVPLG